MPISSVTISRRQALAGLAATTALCTVPAAAETLVTGARPLPGDPEALLERFAYRLLQHEPERATSLGVDIGEHAALRSRIEDLTPTGQQAYATTLREDLA